MKIFLLTHVSLATSLVLLLEEPKNLVVNGDMESVSDGKPTKWVAGCSEGGKVEMLSSVLSPKQGNRCLAMKGSAEWAVTYSDKVAVDRKKGYMLTGYARVKTGTAYIKIDYYEGDKYLETYTSSDEVTGDKWTRLEVKAELEKHTSATHILAVAVASGEFEAWFDDFVLVAK
jgi:hypothetical protein